MKNLMKFSLLIGMIAVLFLSACKKDEPAPTPEPEPTDNFGVFKQYLIDNSMDIPDVLDGWITTAAAIQPELDTYYIIDIRSAEDFANGHIPGAVNTTLGDILTAAGNSGGKPIIVACYTGQTAGHAVLALRLSGYANAKVLKWGMCSWNPSTAVSWPANVGSSAVGNSNWKFPAAPAGNIEFGEPTLETTAEDGAGILAERVAALLAGGMNKVANTDVLASPSSYYVNNYWAEEDNSHYGHIADAYRILPLSLAGGEYKYLNQSATIVSYCWTGQTSSMLTAYLKVLGYDAKSLLFGANGMIYENLESHKWADTEINNFELETSLQPYDGFPTLKEYLVANSMDISDVVNGWITTAEAVYTNMEDGDDTNDFYIIDIRGADDYAAGHIEGAVNSTLGGVLDAAAGANGQPIIVACYTGQTAGHAVTALRLSGYADAKVMMWGMCSWNANTSVSWPANVGNTAVGHTNWTPAPGSLIANNDFGDPSFQTTQADGANILAERVQVLLSGFNGVANTEVLDNNGSYFINNFWAASDVEHYGHITGAFRVNPLTLAGGEYKYLNPGSQVVTYCWTGQTSSMLTAYLKVIGYDSKSLLFGANGMIYDNLESHKWSEGAVMGYPLVTE
jgi:rhodanese-related sulfurtransferase